MKEKGFYFSGSEDSRLFGVLGFADAPQNTGIVFCHSFIDETQYSYRTMVDIGRVLAKNGVPVLRFYCAGFGESDGEFSDTSVSSMVRDTRAAVRIFTEKAGVEKVVLVGVRLGAVTAMMAAESIPEIAGVVLVSPVVDGTRFFNELVRGVQFSEISTASKPRTREEIMQKMRIEGILEIEGGLVSQRMATELSAVNLIEKPVGFQGNLAVSLIPGNRDDAKSERLPEVYRERGCITETWEADSTIFWTNQSMFDPQLPTQLTQNIQRWLSCLN
ncbi:hypothetical protein AB833_24860 [Chromatiales bacterium (ex Bugula neritina AB1)]|nr:hypothetical protein AB833_24860 [Chromatiales bacterium (ex Bugula neritina AB1)]